MHIFGLGLHFIIAVLFAIHALRNGREMYWLLILFMFPLLGSIVYAVVVFIPEMRNSRGARRLAKGIADTLNPGAELRAAQAEFDISPTVANRLRLADALVASQRPADAVPLYRECLQGVHRNDPTIEVKLAGGLLESGDAAGARDLLEALIRREPHFRSQEGHLIYARAVAAAGDQTHAREEFDALLQSSAALDVRAWYADFLAEWGDDTAARALAEDSLRHVHRMPSHARRINDPWIRRLRQILAR